MGRRSRLRAAHAQHRILNTATLLNTVVGVHHTATVDTTWDAGANEKRLPAPIPIATARKVYAWYDAEQTTDGGVPKGACKFPHHEVSIDGTPGAANLAACRNGLARLESADIPDGDRDGVRRHLQAHLDDGKSGSDSKAAVKPTASVRTRARDQLEAHGRQGEPGQTWYRIQNLVQSPGTACVYLYGEVGMFGITSDDFVRDLQGITATAIELHINSMGGDVFEGIAILNALRAHRAAVTTYVDGLAASIASIVAMAGERVVMGQNTTMMIHEAHAIGIGEAGDLRALADLLDKTNDNMASIYAAKAGTDPAQWREAMRAETWYSAEEAVAAGLADEVDGAPAEDDQQSAEPAMVAVYDLSVFRYAGRDKAPAPAIANSAEPVEEPAADPAVEDEPDDTPVAEPEPEPAPAPAADEPDTVWAAATSGLLNDAASTVDELFAALQKEGIPA